MRKAPAWLADFQNNFGAVLRTPLTTLSGTLTSELPASWIGLGVQPRLHRDADAGMSDYHRQYWFRLLSILQKDFPVTAHLMGLWPFNLRAQTYLHLVPPRGRDLGRVRQHFVGFLKDAGCSTLILQAAVLDETRADLFMAPASRSWQWEAYHEADQLRLHAAPDWRIFREDWALVERCIQLEDGHGHGMGGAPKAHAATRTWLIQRDDKGLMHRPVPVAQARLYELLAEKNLADALAILDAETQDPNLQTLVQLWMADSMRWGLWAAE